MQDNKLHSSPAAGTTPAPGALSGKCRNTIHAPLSEGAFPSLPPDTPTSPRDADARVVMARRLQSRDLIKYAMSRGIPPQIASRYCVEVAARGKVQGMLYLNLGFPNNNGGYALKAPSGFKSTTKTGITTINTSGKFTDEASCDTVTVFEGFFDFLSWLVETGSMTPLTDVVVLNSVSNVGRAIPYLDRHRETSCYLDRDEAGRKALESIMHSAGHTKVTDCSMFYYGYNDFNEWLTATKKGRWSW